MKRVFVGFGYDRFGGPGAGVLVFVNATVLCIGGELGGRERGGGLCVEGDAADGDAVQEGSGRSEGGRSDGSGGSPEAGVGICSGARGLASHTQQDVGLRHSGAGGRASRAHVRGGPRHVLCPLEQVSIGSSSVSFRDRGIGLSCSPSSQINRV